MKRVHSHVLLVLDKDTQKTIERMLMRVSTIQDKIASMYRLFTRTDYVDGEWKHIAVKDPTIARTRLLDDLAQMSRSLGELQVIIDNLREEVKAT